MNDRIVKTCLTLNSQPASFIKFFQSCQFNKATQSLAKEFHELSFECQLHNLNFNLPNLNLYVCVSMVNADDLNTPHPHILKCSNSEIRLKSEHLIQGLSSNMSKSYLFELNKETMKCQIKDLYVVTRSSEELEEYFEILSVKNNPASTYLNPCFYSVSENSMNSIIEINLNEQQNIDFESVKENIKFNTIHKSYLNKCRLKVQVLMHDLISNKLENYLTEPIYTEIISNEINLDKKNYNKNLTNNYSITNTNINQLTDTSIINLNNLRILRSSRINGSIDGGDEMIILTSYINPNDIEVEFFQFKNDTEIQWRSMASLNRIEAHGNCALVIKTPRYFFNDKTDQSKKNKNFGKIKVYYRLFRPSTKDYSDKWVFYYCDDKIQDMKNLFGDSIFNESRLFRKLALITSSNSSPDSFNSTKLKRKNIEYILKNEKEESDDSILTENKKKKKLIQVENSIFLKKNDRKKIHASDHETEDDETDDNEKIKLVDTVLDPAKSPFLNDDNDEQKTNDISIKLPFINENKFDKNIQVNLDLLDTNDNDIFDQGNVMSKKKESDIQLKAQLDSCISKMNALAERTGKSLLKFAKTRSLHELLKTQRFLINAIDEEGNTPIHLCILYGNFDLLEIFVEISLTIPYQNVINIKNNKQLTPLLVACHLEEIEVCEYLLEANADLSLTDQYGCNPIHIACKNKNLNLLKVLIKYVEKNCSHSVINSLNHDGYAPLHLAVLSESVDMVRELLYMKNLKINIPDKRAGFTALHHAVSNQNLLNICNLLVKNEKIEIDSKSYNGSTALHIAVANKNYLITCLLYSSGASLNIQNDIPVHFDIDFFLLSIRKNNLLRKCVETILKNKNRYFSSNMEKSMIKKDSNIKYDIIRDKKNEDEESDTEDADKSIYLPDSTKLSKEIKKLYDYELDKDNLEDEPKSKICTHNYDAYFYAQSDPWMLEIFKNNKQIKRDLMEKIFCFENVRKIYFEKQTVESSFKLNSNNIKLMIKQSRDTLKFMEKNQSIGQVKISQQETSFDYSMGEII